MIKTKQSNCIKAYHAVLKLSQTAMPFSAAYKLFKLKQALQPQYIFQSEQEKLLLEQYAKPEKNGTWNFNCEEDKIAFFAKLQEIGEMSVDINIDPQPLSLEGSTISIDDMEALDCFFILE